MDIALSILERSHRWQAAEFDKIKQKRRPTKQDMLRLRELRLRSNQLKRDLMRLTENETY